MKPSVNNSMTERAAITQVMTLKGANMQRIIQVMHTVAEKSFLRACQLFCIPVGEKVASPSEPLPNPPSTVLIVNISNSTLTDCVIGDSYRCAVAAQGSRSQECELRKPSQVKCSCGLGQLGAAQTAPPAPPHPPGEHLNISIHGSSLSYVIIGDNNYMHAEQSEPFP